MKKLKKFCKDNEKTLLLCTGVALGSITTAHFANHALAGMRLVNAEVFDIADKAEKILRVTHLNGTTRDYVWYYTEAAK